MTSKERLGRTAIFKRAQQLQVTKDVPIPIAEMYKCNSCQVDLDMHAIYFLDLPTFQCDHCCSSKDGNKAKRIYCGDECKAADMRDVHYIRCGRQNLLRKPRKPAGLVYKCQYGTGTMLEDMSSSVAWIPGLRYTGLDPESSPVSNDMKVPLDVETAVQEAIELRQIFLDKGRCLCRGINRSIKPCHKFQICWPHLPEGRQFYSFDGCCPELVAGMLEAYAEDVSKENSVELPSGTRHKIAIACLQAALVLYVLMKEMFESCDKLVRMADECRANGFVDKEFKCYTTLTALAWEQPSASCRLWMALHVTIGEARDILEPVNQWRLDLRGDMDGQVDKPIKVDGRDIVRAEDFVLNALGYIMLLCNDGVATRVVGGKAKFLDTHARVLHLMVKVLMNNFRNACTGDQSLGVLKKIYMEIQQHGKVLLDLVGQIPNLYLYYATCITNASCYCRRRIGGSVEGTIAILELMLRGTKRDDLIKTLDWRRREDMKIEARLGQRELRSIYKTKMQGLGVAEGGSGDVHVII